MNIQAEGDKTMDTIIGIVNEYIGSDDPSVLVKQLIEVGAHYGHPTRAWNPLMADFIHGKQGNCHVIDLKSTVRYLLHALEFLFLSAKENKKILFVCTSQQMSEVVTNEAKRCMQYYVANRWLGGTLTNWMTVKKRIDKLHDLEKILSEDSEHLKKREILQYERQIKAIRGSLGGIEFMGDLPDVVVISSLVKENIAVDEINRLKFLGVNIQSVGFCDTNSNPNQVDYPIPVNDDSIRVIEFLMLLGILTVCSTPDDQPAAPCTPERGTVNQVTDNAPSRAERPVISTNPHDPHNPKKGKLYEVRNLFQ